MIKILLHISYAWTKCAGIENASAVGAVLRMMITIPKFATRIDTYLSNRQRAWA